MKIRRFTPVLVILACCLILTSCGNSLNEANVVSITRKSETVAAKAVNDQSEVNVTTEFTNTENSDVQTTAKQTQSIAKSSQAKSTKRNTTKATTKATKKATSNTKTTTKSSTKKTTTAKKTIKTTKKTTTTTKARVKGDVNGNGKIDVQDYTKLMRLITSGESTEKYVSIADMNGDGVVGLSDARILEKMLSQ